MAIFPNYKEIIDLVKKGATLEAQEKIIELREGALELQEENVNLKEEVAKLKKQLESKENLFFDGSVYWKTGAGTDQNEDDPYCQKCHDADGKLIRIHNEQFNSRPRWHCRTCGQWFNMRSNQLGTR